MKDIEHGRKGREERKKFTLPTCQHNFAPAASFFSVRYDVERVRQACCLATGGEQPAQRSNSRGRGGSMNIYGPYFSCSF